MKYLIIPVLALLFFSCEANCDEERDSLRADYIRALQNTTNPATIDEINRQYNERLNNLDC